MVIGNRAGRSASKASSPLAGNNLALGGRTDTNQDATLHWIGLSLCVECPAPLQRNIKLLLVICGVVMLRVVLPIGRHPDGVHAELGQAETLACKEKLLTMLK